MKRSIVAALCCAAVAIALPLSATFISPAHAQSVPAPANQQTPRRTRLNLTAEQRARMKQIKESTRSQIEAVLNPTQLAQYKTARETARQNRQKPKQMMASLNLSPEQQARIRQIREAAKKEMQSVLTAEQLQQMQQFKNNRQQQ